LSAQLIADIRRWYLRPAVPRVLSVTENDQKEEFSRAYIQAIAAVAGYTTSRPSIDDDSVDLTIASRGGSGTIRSPKLDIQAKCTAKQKPSEPEFSFPLELKNYNDLRPANVMVPRILVVVLVPDDLNDWTNHCEDELTLRRCGYWYSLRGMGDTQNETSVTLKVPRTNSFSVVGLQAIMSRVATQGYP
jgi:hypothetical protein